MCACGCVYLGVCCERACVCVYATVLYNKMFSNPCFLTQAGNQTSLCVCVCVYVCVCVCVCVCIYVCMLDLFVCVRVVVCIGVSVE